MKVKVKYNSKIAKMINVGGITLYPYVLISITENYARATHTLNHEWVHVEQVRKLGWFKFYFMYFYYFMKTFIKVWNYDKAYMSIPYEIEAYEKQKTQVLPDVLE